MMNVNNSAFELIGGLPISSQYFLPCVYCNFDHMLFECQCETRVKISLQRQTALAIRGNCSVLHILSRPGTVIFVMNHAAVGSNSALIRYCGIEDSGHDFFFTPISLFSILLDSGILDQDVIKVRVFILSFLCGDGCY